MSTSTDEITKAAYECFKRLDGVIHREASDDGGSWVDPSEYENQTAETDPLERVLDAESYPGEAFDLLVDPDLKTFIPAFAAEVDIQPDDIVGVAAPSNQLYDEFFFTLYSEIANGGAVLTTKYPSATLRSRLSPVDPVIIDCTPGARTDGGVDSSQIDPRPVQCGDLTSVGVAAERATTRVAGDEGTATFGIATATQLLAHHDTQLLNRFLHELVGQWRNQAVGGLIHVPPQHTGFDGAGWFGSEHFDYVIQVRTEDGRIEARVNGKHGIAPVWLPIGVSGRRDERSTRMTASEVGQLDVK